MNPVSFLMPAPAPGAQRSATAPGAAPGQFGDMLSSLLGPGENTPDAGTPATPEVVTGEPDAGAGEQTAGTQLPVPGFVLPDDYRPMAPVVLAEPDAAVEEAPETATTEPAAPGAETPVDETPEAGTAAPDTAREATAPSLPAATLPVAPQLPAGSPVPVAQQQPIQPEDPAAQEPADGAEHPAGAAAKAGPVLAGFAVAAQPRPTAAIPAEKSEQPLTATGALAAEAGADLRQVSAQTPAASLVPAVAATAGQPVAALLRPMLIPVDENQAGAAPVGLAAGSVQLEPATATAPTVAPAPVRTNHAEPLHRQLAGPLLMLATGPHGERTLSLQVAPEALGPITVKAVIGAEGLRVELTAPGEAGREALRAMLPDLRRELASTGAGTVHIGTGPDQGGTGNGPASGGAGHFAPGRQGPGSAAGPQQVGTAHLTEPAAAPTSTTRSTGLDVLA